MKKALLTIAIAFTTIASFAQAGAALNFNGTSSQVNLGTGISTALTSLNKLTVEAWIYPTSTTGSYKTIVGNYSNPANQLQFDMRLQGNSVVFFVNVGAGFQFAQTAANTITLNTWQHVAGVWDGNLLNIYINGALSNSACCATGTLVATTNSVVIGGNTVPEMFTGSIDETRIWTRALCQGEIQNNMNGELALPQTGLLAYYQFNQGIASGNNSAVTTLNDVTANYNGALTGFALTGTTSNWIAPGGVTSGVNAAAFVSPSISVAGPSIIGVGSSATFTASGNVATYTWSANAGSATTATVTVSPTVTTTYSVVGTNSVGCISNAAVQTLSVNPVGAALDFDGTSSQVNLGTGISTALTSLNAITVEAWIYPTSTTGSYKTIIGNYSNPANEMQFDMRLQGNSIVFFVDCGSGFQFAQTAANTITLNTWQHIAGVWDGNLLNIYINGALSNSACCATGSLVATTNPVVIGGNSVPEMFTGSIDETRIWTRALCQGEIQNNMNAELALPQTGLLAYYKLNQGVSAGNNSTVTTAADSSGNGYNGTLTGFALTGTTSNWIAPGGVTSGVNAATFVSPSISVAGPSIIGVGSSATFTASGNVATYTWSANAGSATTATVTVSPTVTTTYSVVGTNSVGCNSNMVVQTLSVNPVGAALDFDGASSQVNLGTGISTALTSLNQITVEAWIYPTSTTGSFKTIIGNYSNPANQLQFDMRLQGNSVVFFVNVGAGFQFAQTAANTITLNTWQHVAGVWDGNLLNIYINGALSNSACCATGTLVATTNSVVIGGNTVPEMFTGSIDETRIWTRALCQGEIQNNMNAELALPQTGLLAYYKFNQGLAAVNNATVTTAADSSGNGYNGTLTGFALTGTTSNWVAPGAVTSGVNAAAFVSPSISISGASTAICSGTTTTLTASGNASTYTWTAGPTTAMYAVTPTVNTTYSVVGTNSVGCNSNMAVSTLTVNSLPSVTASVNTLTICIGAVDTINAGGAITYMWSSNAGSAITATVAVSPTVTTTYTVMGTDGNGCMNTNTVTVNVQTCSAGLNQLTGSTNLVSVSPNPSNGTFTISSANAFENTSIVIYNNIGQLVFTQQLNKEAEVLNTNLVNGLYTLRIQNAQGTITQRIMIQR